MNMMPFASGMPSAMPPAMPSDEQIQQAQLILDACSWDEVSGILRSDDRRNYSIDVETDATAFEDEEAEKQQRIEFVKAMTEFMGFWGPAIQMNPSVAPFAKELAQFALGAFRAGRTLEESLSDAFDQIKDAPPQPNPEAEMAKAEMAMAQQKHALEMQKGQADVAGKQQVAQLTAAGKQGELQVKQQSAQMDMAAQQQQMQADREKAQLDLQIEYAKLELERERMAMEREKMGLDLQMASQKAQIDQQNMVMQNEAQAEKSAMDLQTHREASDLKRDDMQFNSEFKRKEAERKASEKPKSKGA